MASNSQTVGSGSNTNPLITNVHEAPHPALATLGSINDLASSLFHPVNIANGLNLHHHIVKGLLDDLEDKLKHAVSSMQARAAVSVQAQNTVPVVNGTDDGTAGTASIATSSTAVEGYQLPSTFASDTFGIGWWADEQ